MREETPLGLAAAIFIVCFWVCVVVASGAGWNPAGVPWNFSATAQLGDSFGVVSSAMAGIAAYYAYATFAAQRRETATLQRRAAEPSFLNLLERRFDVLDQVSTTARVFSGDHYEYPLVKGQAALEVLTDDLMRNFRNLENESDRKKEYEHTALNMARGITHYHRFVFHIILFAQNQFSSISENRKMNKGDAAYQYVKLLRAQMSDEEMLLMALNAIYGGGFPKLKHLIERYALLNNLRLDWIQEIGLDNLFEKSAFGLLIEDRPF